MRAAFKTPGLRNVALTAPYQHDGSEASLADVVRFYNLGGRDPRSYGKSLDIRPLNLADADLGDLVAFLGHIAAHRPPASSTGGRCHLQSNAAR